MRLPRFTRTRRSIWAGWRCRREITRCSSIWRIWAAWELIVNKQTGQSGLEYDAKQDLGRVKMTMSKPPALVEQMKFTLATAGGNKGKLTLAWENVVASVNFTVK